MKKILLTLLMTMMATINVFSMTSYNDGDDNVNMIPDQQPVVLNCERPDYLKAGDKVALISPAYFTPMENVEKTAEVLRTWGLEPVVGPNVGKTDAGKW